MLECPRPGCIKRLTSTSQRGAAVPAEQAVAPPAAGEHDDGCPYCSRPLASACRIVCCSIPEHRRTYHEKCFEKHKLRAYRAGSQKYAFDRMKDDQVGCAVNRCSGKLETVVSTKLLAFGGSGGGGAAAAASVEDGDSAASTCALCSEALWGHCVDTYCGLHAHTVHQHHDLRRNLTSPTRAEDKDAHERDGSSYDADDDAAAGARCCDPHSPRVRAAGPSNPPPRQHPALRSIRRILPARVRGLRERPRMGGCRHVCCVQTVYIDTL